MNNTIPAAFHKVFSSHMVLQREKPVVFSGTAAPGAKLSLTFAGLTREFTADPSGEWRAAFPAMAAGACSDAVLYSSGGATVTLSDLIMGDVWFCSGQSNMEMPVWSEEKFYRAADPEALLADCDIPNLRLCNVNADCYSWRRFSPDGPLAETTAAGWSRSSREAVEDTFSCLAFLFGRQLHRETGVPVGLINCSWGGTRIQAWISREKFEREHYEPILKELDQSPKAVQCDLTALKEWLQKDFYGYGRTVQPADVERWAAFDYDDSHWEKGTSPFLFERPGVHGIRFAFDLPQSFQGQKLTLELGGVNDVDVTRFNGETIGATGIDIPGYWCALRTYTVPAHLVKAGRNVLYIHYENHYGTGSIVLSAKHGKIYPAGRPELALPIDGCIRICKAFDAPPERVGTRPPVGNANDYGPATPNYPSTLFNGMAAPFFRLAVKGVIWYQGCNNAGESTYLEQHKMLIEDWRERWHDPELPFLLVQLAGFEEHTPAARLKEDYWKALKPQALTAYALTRELQAEVVHRLPNVGMAVAMDAGDASDIHPHDKRSVACRLVREAERIAYGMPVASRGPEFDRFEVGENGAVRVFFTHAENGLKTSDGERPGAFALVDKNGHSVWCQGVIEGATVLLSSPEIPEPVAVRYAFCQYRGDVNLLNEEGFPCVPFRSDRSEAELR